MAKVIEGAGSRDYEKVQAYATQLVEKLSANGELECAKRIMQALGKAPISALSLARGAASAPPIPADGESRVPTADEEWIERGAVDLFLPDEATEVLHRLINYFRNASLLAANGVSVSCSMGFLWSARMWQDASG